LSAVLDPEERRRAAAFRHPADSRRFVARRGRLRELLAQRLGCAPAEVTLARNAFGKPFVAGAAFGFSLSHSLETAMVVFAPGAEVGCDIEWRRPALATRRAAQRFFSQGEVERLGAIAPDQWVEAFFNCWTRKEALVKALGQGLSYPLKAFDVSLAPGEPAALLCGPPGWTLHAGQADDGLHAAVALSAAEG
jgi:4'-phosphopantetheinyl transferase